MAIVSRKVSDISGQEGADEQFATVVVRQHPKIDQPKALDVLVNELDLFEEVGDLVMLEIKMPDGGTREVYVRAADFNKLAPNMDQVLKNARGTRGRLPAPVATAPNPISGASRALHGRPRTAHPCRERSRQGWGRLTFSRTLRPWRPR